jgi:hypothetical protein
LQSFELISVKRCQSDTCRQTAMPRALQHVRHARVAPYTPYRRLSARARTRAFPRPTSRLPKVQRPEDERPKAAPDPSAMGVCALRVEPARARTPFCRAAGVPPGRCPWLAFPSVPPRLRPWWTSPIKRPERSRVHRAAPCHHRSATVRPPLRQLPSPVGTSNSLSSTYPGSHSRGSSRACSSFTGQLAAMAGPSHRRRAPSPAPLHPNQAHKPVAGESLLLLPTFPGQGRRQSRPIPASRAGQLPQGPNCVFPVLSRVLSAKQGPTHMESKILGTSLQIDFLNSTCVWLKLVKYVENCRKKQKNANPILLDS